MAGSGTATPPPTPPEPDGVPPMDLELPPEIAGNGDPPVGQAPALVTGAAGFLGAAVVAELLATTDQPVYCLVRARDEAHAAERTRSALHYYGLWREHWQQRVCGVAGDLGQPRCGLPEQVYARLANDVGRIYHSGAGVNVSYPYQALRAVNVDGTVEMLRLAATARPKRVAHVSTVSVLYGGRARHPVPDLCRLPPLDGLGGGYPVSKWVSEHLAAQARERGLDVRVFRPGTLSGSTATGVSNPNDYTWLVVRACAAIGQAPMVTTAVRWAPVDFAARAIVHLTTQQGPAPDAYHLVAPNEVRYATVASWMRRYGFNMRTTDISLWRRRVLEAAVTGDDPALRQLAATLPDAASSPEPLPVPQVDTACTDAILAKEGIHCPPLDEQLLSHYLSTAIRRGELPTPTQ